MKLIEIFGLKVFSDHLKSININSNRTMTINTISPNSYGISTKDPLFKEALKKSDYLVLDGVYFALASIFIKGKNIKKNQGPEVFDFFIKKMNSESGRVFFLGASSKTLEKIKHRLKSEYKNITSEFLSPPFKSDFSIEDNNLMVEAINNFKPDIVFVGMTCPKQEKWAHQNKNKLDVKLICSVGAVFDWYAGNQKDIHPLWWKLRLGWLKRTIDRPEILKRYPNIGIFFWHLILAFLRIKKYK
ncbi:WecB/TagA/CpsF family glycosyltransferase [Polaribacter sp.]|jgi:N-acetylglucosaminyldiphosphoundecaprenol N-acetyl-beta-D-mannosaminyltransferase|nr:WecB/TagA/CpsF family glycosyltransferase [Polaribacter sp.]